MDSLGNPTLARIWADATPLARFMEERAEQECRESTPARNPTRARQPSTMELLAASMQFQRELASARDKARTATINDLIAGRIVGLGRPSDSYLFERVEVSFWIGAVVDWMCGTASRDGRTVIEVRVVPAGVLKPVQPEAHEAPGRPSMADVIRAAIADYAKADPALRRPPTERYRAYRAYISARGYDPHRDPGFTKKTYEKYEREFRLRFK